MLPVDPTTPVCASDVMLNVGGDTSHRLSAMLDSRSRRGEVLVSVFAKDGFKTWIPLPSGSYLFFDGLLIACLDTIVGLSVSSDMSVSCDYMHPLGNVVRSPRILCGDYDTLEAVSGLLMTCFVSGSGVAVG